MRDKGAQHLFESSWKKPYSNRGIRKIIDQYSREVGMGHAISPHKLRHFLFTLLIAYCKFELLTVKISINPVVVKQKFFLKADVLMLNELQMLKVRTYHDFLSK